MTEKIAIIQPGLMTSAYKTALALAKKTKVVCLIGRNKPFPGFVNSKSLKIYEMWDWLLPDPINATIVPGIFCSTYRVLRKEKPTIWLVYKHMFLTSLAAPFLKLFGQKVIVVTDTFPGHIWWTRSRFVNLAMWLYARTLGKLVLASADKVVILYEGLEETAKKLGLDYTVIHNGVDLALYDNAKPAPDLSTQGNTIITYIGRLHKVKGYDDFIAVAHELAKKRKDIEFWIVGNNEDQHESTNSIKFLGYRNDIPCILKHTDIYVLPSYAEGLPNTLMEAMACGKACIASAVGGVKYLIQDGKNGLLITPGNRKQLQDTIKKILAQPELRERLGHAARDTIRDQYDWNTLAKEWMDLIKSICEKK